MAVKDSVRTDLISQRPHHMVVTAERDPAAAIKFRRRHAVSVGTAVVHVQTVIVVFQEMFEP